MCVLPNKATAQIELLKQASSQYLIKGKDQFDIVNFFINDNRVQDALRYQLKRHGQSYRMHPFDWEPIHPNNFADMPARKVGKHCIVIIMESPHKDEYSSDGLFTPIGPAQGTTGYNINLLFEEIFRTQILPNFKKLNDHFDVILCNPVQFQTSLHEIIKHSKKFQGLRNTIWKGLFHNLGEKELFLKRISLYKSSIIINACTSKIKQDVTIALTESTSRYEQLYEASSHPCWWRVKHPVLSLISSRTQNAQAKV